MYIHIMLISFPEQNFNNFIIPAFQINEGEIVVVEFPGGALFQPLLAKLKSILTGTVAGSHVEINPEFRFVEHFKESFLTRRFAPVTIGKYHQKHANKHNPVYEKIHNTPSLTAQTKVNTLTGDVRKRMELYTTLSWTNRLIIDLTGVDPKGGTDIFNAVKQAIMPNGAAIVIDSCDEFKDQCTTFVKVNYIGADIRSDSVKLISKSK
ncbi:hypothetical protein MTO98_28975 [Mucilaginibacter sp. SMC90]|uniref:hypothetical protein n=1 Tax=Mucilaginibacter sp. SMC90 TaxID=2929803 RepID=UPI001FB40B8F|nr:hypothetical protein [Mucilaginibacter sp. SMC90]UOE48446.1 hypothetical protein MTO98_28975 [Mucilaginibacter sp. SMC90]